MMKKFIMIGIATLIVPLYSVADDTPRSDDWLSENVILSIEIEQADQAVQKFSLVTAKKEFYFAQTMQWKIDPSASELKTIFLHFTGNLDSLDEGKYLLDSELILKIPNFILPEDKDLPFLENGWGLGMIVSEGEKMSVIDNTNLKVHLTLKRFTPDKK